MEADALQPDRVHEFCNTGALAIRRVIRPVRLAENQPIVLIVRAEEFLVSSLLPTVLFYDRECPLWNHEPARFI
jgi:hypothetical protein